MSFFFVFLVSWLNSKGLFADLKFELFNIINPTLSTLVSLLLVSTLFMNDVLKVTTALHSSVSFGFFFLRQDKSKCGYSLTWSWKSMFDYSIKNRTSQSNCLSECLESLTCIEGVLLPILNLNAFNCPSFILTDFSFKNPLPSLIFSQVFKTS